MNTLSKVLEVKQLGDFQHGETAIVTLNIGKVGQLTIDCYFEDVKEYFGIKEINEVFDLNHFSSDSVSNMPDNIYEFSVNIIYKAD